VNRQQLRCLIVDDSDTSRALGDLVADGKITAEDAEAVIEFAEYLRRLAAEHHADSE